MKRTTIVVDEELLEEARRLSGKRTYSKTVELALADLVRRMRARKILQLEHSGLWRGSSSETRTGTDEKEG